MYDEPENIYRATYLLVNWVPTENPQALELTGPEPNRAEQGGLEKAVEWLSAD